MSVRLQAGEAMFLYFQREERTGRGVFRPCLSSQSPEMWQNPVSNTGTAGWVGDSFTIFCKYNVMYYPVGMSRSRFFGSDPLKLAICRY